MTAASTVLIATVLAATGSLVLAAELYARRLELRTAFAWDVLETQYASLVLRPDRAATVRRLAEGWWFDASLLARFPLVIAAVALTAAGRPAAGIAALTLVILNATLHARLLYGLDASDQMSTIVWAGLAAYWLTDVEWAQNVALGFVAAQFALAYLTSGLAKMVSDEWRGGSALPGIFSSGNHGLELAAALVRHRSIAVAGCWTILLVESLGPAVAVLHPVGLAVFVALSIAFHVGVAVVMGLNLFLWSFVASLTCFAWAATQIHGFL